MSTTQKSNFSEPKPSEPKPISVNRPSEQLGKSDKSNESTPGATENEKPETKRKFKPIIKKQEEKVEEEDWNTEPKDDGNGPHYSYEDLRKKKIPDLDYLNREKYLSPYDFMAVFKVKKSEVETWPKWKKTKAKRTAKLF